MSINLSINFSHPDSVSQRVRYARIDNTSLPVFVNVVPNPVTSPAVIATDIPNGQYLIESAPVYADGRACAFTQVYTPGCPGLISINAYMSSDNLVIEYLAPSEVPKIRATVNYPNGGSYAANYVNDGNNIVIPIPVSVQGDILVAGQSVCDEDSGFMSDFSSQVTVNRTSTNISITSTVPGVTIDSVGGIPGFTLPNFVEIGGQAVGTHGAFYAPISVHFTGTPSISSNAGLYLNGTLIQCVNLPNTDGGSADFTAASFTANDQLAIGFSTGSCP